MSSSNSAVRKLKRQYRRKKRREKGVSRFFINLAIIAIVVFGSINVISDKIEINSQKKELAELEEEALELEMENATYEAILTQEDERAYMEKIAIDELGYAYPDEVRFYDTTRS